MHELSIAMNILEIVQEECRKAGSEKVVELILEVGDLSGVDVEALTTCLQIASRETLLDGASMVINRHPGKGYCGKCGEEFVMEDILSLCPFCFQPAVELREGQEMRIEEISVK